MKIHLLRNVLINSGGNKGNRKIANIVILEMIKMDQRKYIIVGDILAREMDLDNSLYKQDG
jgi:hypothetical protein